MTEPDLIQAAKAGNQDAFTLLHERHAKAIKRIFFKMHLGEEAEDLCQDTFLLAFTKLDRFDGKCQLKTWLVRIALNRAFSFMRTARQPSNGTNMLIPLDFDGDKYAVQDEELARLPERLAVEHLLKGLTPLNALVLKAWLDGYTTADIRRVTGQTENGVKMMVHLTQKRMRCRYEESKRRKGTRTWIQ